MKKIIVTISIMVAMLAISAQGFAYDNNNYNGPYNFNSMMGNWGWPMMGGYYSGFGWILMILWWLIIIVLIVALISWAVRQSGKNQDSKEKTPLDILKERYAKGEIDKEEFKAKKKDLI